MAFKNSARSLDQNQTEAFSPHSNPLPMGEGEKQIAAVSQISYHQLLFCHSSTL
jgi:hypothetical protein